MYPYACQSQGVHRPQVCYYIASIVPLRPNYKRLSSCLPWICLYYFLYCRLSICYAIFRSQIPIDVGVRLSHLALLPLLPCILPFIGFMVPFRPAPLLAKEAVRYRCIRIGDRRYTMSLSATRKEFSRWWVVFFVKLAPKRLEVRSRHPDGAMRMWEPSLGCFCGCKAQIMVYGSHSRSVSRV